MTTSTPRPPNRPTRVAIELVAAKSAVRSSIDHEHAARLAEVLDRCPPIVVAENGTVLIDGLHRLEAARLRGWDTIPVVFVPVASPADLLLAAASANRAHGLPLTREQRRDAVEALLRLGTTLSDRALASACGVARTTVAALRAEGRPRSGGVNTCSAGEPDRPRLGQDNKHYPGASRHLGRAAESIVRLEPAITVRALAQRLGASVDSAHRYRADTLARLRDERPWVRFLRRLMARLWLWRRRRRPA